MVKDGTMLRTGRDCHCSDVFMCHMSPSPWIYGFSLKQAVPGWQPGKGWEMEGTKQLMQVIQEMRSEIIKLERENRALRGELQFDGPKGAKQEEGKGGEAGKEEAWSHPDSGEEAAVALRRNVSAGSALMLQEQKGIKQPGGLIYFWFREGCWALKAKTSY